MIEFLSMIPASRARPGLLVLSAATLISGAAAPAAHAKAIQETLSPQESPVAE